MTGFAHTYRDHRHRSAGEGMRSIDETRASFGEVHQAAFDLMFSEGQSVSARRWRQEGADFRRLRAEAAAGRELPELDALDRISADKEAQIRRLIDQGTIYRDGDGELRVGPGSGLPRVGSLIEQELDIARSMFFLDELRAQHGDDIPGDDQVREYIVDRARRLREGAEASLSRAGGASGAVAQFTGTGLGAVTDPAIAATMLVSGGTMTGSSIAGNAARAFAFEAGLGGSTEALIQFGAVKPFKESIQSPYSTREAAYNVLAAGGFAGALRATGSVTVDLAAAAVAKARASRILTPEQHEAADALELYSVLVGKKPTRAGTDDIDLVGEAEHFEAIDQAAADLEAGRQVDLTGVPHVDADDATMTPPTAAARAYAQDMARELKEATQEAAARLEADEVPVGETRDLFRDESAPRRNEAAKSGDEATGLRNEPGDEETAARSRTHLQRHRAEDPATQRRVERELEPPDDIEAHPDVVEAMRILEEEPDLAIPLASELRDDGAGAVTVRASEELERLRQYGDALQDIGGCLLNSGGGRV